MSSETDDMQALVEESEQFAELSKRFFEEIQRERAANTVSSKMLAAAAAGLVAVPWFDAAMKGT